MLFRWTWCPLLLLVAIAGCVPNSTAEPPRTVNLYQQWELQPGSTVAGYQIAGGLGDISVQLDGGNVYAPFDGKVSGYAESDRCIVFSSAEVPAYLFRFCGLTHVRLGEVQQGTTLGRGQQFQFALLRKQSDGTWALVEPSSSMLERSLQN